jgi:hypothetical protein
VVDVVGATVVDVVGATVVDVVGATVVDVVGATVVDVVGATVVDVVGATVVDVVGATVVDVVGATVVDVVVGGGAFQQKEMWLMESFGDARSMPTVEGGSKVYRIPPGPAFTNTADTAMFDSKLKKAVPPST